MYNYWQLQILPETGSSSEASVPFYLTKVSHKSS